MERQNTLNLRALHFVDRFLTTWQINCVCSKTMIWLVTVTKDRQKILNIEKFMRSVDSMQKWNIYTNQCTCFAVACRTALFFRHVISKKNSRNSTIEQRRNAAIKWSQFNFFPVSSSSYSLALPHGNMSLLNLAASLSYNQLLNLGDAEDVEAE